MHRALKGPRPLVFAHRGGAKLGPENTLAAFDRGLAAGADGLELDVRLSRDGEVMVIHDATLDRTTDARGPVCDRTAEELGRVNVLGSGEGIPRLADALLRYPDAPMIIELKEGPELARRTVDLVRDLKAIDRVVIGSFLRSALKEVRRSEPRLPTGSSHEETRLAVYASRLGLAPHWASYRSFQVPECTEGIRVVSTNFVKLAHRAGVSVHVWVVDEPDDIVRLLSWGVDGIITDRPDVAVSARQAWMNNGRGA